MSTTILIVESGASYWKWALFNPQGKQDVCNGALDGYNPQIHSHSTFKNRLEHMLGQTNTDLDQFTFYGSGIFEEQKAQHLDIIQSVFSANTFRIEDDLHAIIDGYGRQKTGWYGILGTGSNLQYWNGSRIESKIPSFGYLAGDEGSGYHIFLEVMKKFYRQGFSSQLSDALSTIFTESYFNIIRLMYHTDQWSQFRYAYMDKLKPFWNDSEIRRVGQKCIDQYIEKILYPAQKLHPNNIILCGSVAFSFKDYICEKWNDFSTNKVSIYQNPMDGLIEKYQNGY